MATVRGSLHTEVKIDGAKETARAFNRLARTAQDEIRKETLKLSRELAVKQRMAARGDGPQSSLLAPTVRAVGGRVPGTTAGGAAAVGRQGESAGALIFSSEFGQNKRSGWYGKARYRGSMGKQWHPHLGQAGYWFFPTFRREQDEIQRKWLKALERLLNRWGAGG